MDSIRDASMDFFGITSRDYFIDLSRDSFMNFFRHYSRDSLSDSSRVSLRSPSLIPTVITSENSSGN